MKKRSLIVLLIAAVLAAMCFTACSKSEEKMTLEKYVSDNPDVQTEIDQAMGDTNIKVEIKGNEIIYTSDLSTMDSFTEETAKSDAVVKALDEALGAAGATFGDIAKKLEEQTEVTGISVTVNYTWGDEVLVTKSFTAADAEAAEDAGEADKDAEAEASEEAEAEDGE